MEKHPAGAFPSKAIERVITELKRMERDWRFGCCQVYQDCKVNNASIQEARKAALIADKAIAKMVVT